MDGLILFILDKGGKNAREEVLAIETSGWSSQGK